jgi:hypothetical protein
MSEILTLEKYLILTTGRFVDLNFKTNFGQVRQCLNSETLLARRYNVHENFPEIRRVL